MKKRTWYRLDNAAKIYPPTSNSKRSGVFALSAILNEKIDKEILNDAVSVVLLRFPIFKVKLKRGVFWYYLEENKNPFYVKEESPSFLDFINEAENNEYLFKVFYFENKITLSMFHALTDGTGGMEVLKAIVFEYLLLKGYNIKADNELKTIYSPVVDEESDDTFLKVYNKKCAKTEKETNAFKINGTPFSNNGTGIVTARVSVDDLKILAKKYNATITGFLVGLVTDLIYKNYIKEKRVKNKQVKVLVPINLRKFYSSTTIRNFALFTRPGYDYSKGEISLEECIEMCSEQIKKGAKKEVLDSFISKHVKIERNPLLKIAPLFLKDIAMKLAYSKVGDNLHTTSLSNLGIVNLPESVKKYVKDFVFTLGASHSAKHSLAVISYNGFTNITFSRMYVETNLERDFVRFLTENNAKVTLFSNYWEDNQ
jgi:NRPS condensation-like uncharacterized protein